jgi:predicted Zn-dependent peptidase
MKPPILFDTTLYKTAHIQFPDTQSVSLHLRGRAGSNYETESQVGSAHLIEHLAVASSATKDLRAKIQNSGGKIFGITSRDDVLIIVRILKAHLALGVQLLSQVFDESQIATAKFLPTKDSIKLEVKKFLEDPEKLIGRVAYKIIFPNTRLARFNTGSLDDIDSLKVEKALEFYKARYTPQNFVLVASGDIVDTKFEKLVENYFGKSKVGVAKPAEKFEPTVFAQTKGFAGQTIVLPHYAQTHVKIDYYGVTYNDKQKYAAMILAKVLDGYIKSSLKNELGIAYTINCDSFSAESYGLFGFYAAVEDKNFERVCQEIIACTKSKLTKEAVEAAKESIVAEMLFYFDKISGRADFYSEHLLFGTGKQSHETEIKKIKAASVAEVLAAGNQIFATDPKVTVMTKRTDLSDLKKYF